MPKTKQMTWKAAILKVLEGASEPLHYQEGVLAEIGKQSLRTAEEKNAPTVAALLSNLVAEGLVVRPSRGFFALSSSGNDSPESPETAEREDTGAFFPYGRFWSADRVDWRNRELMGWQPDVRRPINFATHPALYLLHHSHATMGIVYVGEASANSLFGRLNAHRGDACAGRWDAFSWFSFRPVTPDGNATEEPSFDRTRLIELIETIMIESLTPPLNRKWTGMGEFVRYEQFHHPSR